MTVHDGRGVGKLKNNLLREKGRGEREGRENGGSDRCVEEEGRNVNRVHEGCGWRASCGWGISLRIGAKIRFSVSKWLTVNSFFCHYSSRPHAS